jgi:TIR domain
MQPRKPGLHKSCDLHRPGSAVRSVYDESMERPQPSPIFISYAGEDLSWAEWIASELEAAGHRTILQAWDFRAGGNWVVEMHQALGKVDYMLAVLSPHYLHSEMTQAEWTAMFARDPSGNERRLIPIRVQHCEPTGLLSQVIYEDLVGLEEWQARKGLIRSVSRVRVSPGKAVEFPGKAGRRFPGSSDNQSASHPPRPLPDTAEERIAFDRIPLGPVRAETRSALVTTEYRFRSDSQGKRRIEVDVAFLVMRLMTGLMVKASLSIGCTEADIELSADGAQFVACDGEDSSSIASGHSDTRIAATRLSSSSLKWEVSQHGEATSRLLRGNCVLSATFAPVSPVDFKSRVRPLDRRILDREQRPLGRLGTLALMAKLVASGERLPVLSSVEETIRLGA